MKTRRKELPLPTLLLIGTGISLAAVVFVSFIFSIIASLTSDPANMIGIFSLLSLIIAGAASGFLTSKLFGSGGAVIAFLSSVIAAALLCIIGLTVKGGSIGISVILNYLAYIGATALLAFIATKKRTRRTNFRH